MNNQKLIDYLNKKNIKSENTSDGLVVKGSLSLHNCTSLTSLPDNLIVGGYLGLRGCTGLKRLPEGLIVRGYLYLSGCTLYSFDSSKYDIIGEYKIIPNSYRFIIED